MSTAHEKFLIDFKGKKTGIVLSLKRYRKFTEDLHDLGVVAERRSEPTISFEEMNRRWNVAPPSRRLNGPAGRRRYGGSRISS